MKMFWSDFLKNKEVFHIASKKQEICEKNTFCICSHELNKDYLACQHIVCSVFIPLVQIAQLFRRY